MTNEFGSANIKVTSGEKIMSPNRVEVIKTKLVSEDFAVAPQNRLKTPGLPFPSKHRQVKDGFWNTEQSVFS